MAVDYLETNGHQVLERNFRFKRSEIDVVSKLAELLCFTEVKYRSDDNFGEPEDFVSVNQQQKILEAASHFILEIDWHGDIRFDIIAIKEIKGRIEIKHFEDAFY